MKATQPEKALAAIIGRINTAMFISADLAEAERLISEAEALVPAQKTEEARFLARIAVDGRSWELGILQRRAEAQR